LNAFEKPNKVLDFILVVALIITCYSVYGLIVFLSGDNSILWFEKWASIGALTSTFVNRNSFAAFAGIGLQCIIAYSFWFMSKKLSRTDTGGHRFVTILATNYSRVTALMLSGIILLTALLLTGSRGGGSTTLLSCLAMVGGLVFLVRDKKARRRKSFFVVSLFICIAATISISGDNFFKRIDSLDTGDMRFKIYKGSLEAIQDRPYLGFGLGTFADAFAQYRSPDVFPGPVPVSVLRAHSDVIELAVTAGVPIATIALIAYMYAIVYFFKSALQGQRYSVFLLLIGALFLQLGLHSIIDFPFQVPSVSYLFTGLLAAGVYLVHEQIDHSANGGM
jgi:O-antigen ligase